MATIQTEFSGRMVRWLLRALTPAVWLMFLAVFSNCGRPAPATSPQRSAPLNSSPAAAPSAMPVPNSASDLKRQVAPSSPGNRMARVVVHNAYLIAQYLFIDEQARATLAPNAERAFELPPGAHTISVSDSKKGDQNAHYIAEVFDAGYEYRYDVVTR